MLTCIKVHHVRLLDLSTFNLGLGLGREDTLFFGIAAGFLCEGEIDDTAAESWAAE